MSLNIQSVTVAIADADRDRRGRYERFLQNEPGIALLTSVASNQQASNDHTFVDRRLNPRDNLTESEHEVARIKRLKPLVLLVNLNLCTDEDYALLLSLRSECPDALMVVLLADDSIREDQMLKIMGIGARGYLRHEAVELHISKAIKVVGCGEAWVPRKMMGDMMDQLNTLQHIGEPLTNKP